MIEWAEDAAASRRTRQPPPTAVADEPAAANRRFGFRRRCGWCAVVLRGWQLNLCRRCKQRTNDAGLYLQSAGPWCGHLSRADAEPDRWRRW